jgi:hypothetical protein
MQASSSTVRCGLVSCSCSAPHGLWFVRGIAECLFGCHAPAEWRHSTVVCCHATAARARVATHASVALGCKRGIMFCPGWGGGLHHALPAAPHSCHAVVALLHFARVVVAHCGRWLAMYILVACNVLTGECPYWGCGTHTHRTDGCALGTRPHTNANPYRATGLRRGQTASFMASFRQ